MVIYVTISYGDYRERGTAGAGPEDATRHQILEDKQRVMWQDVDCSLLALQPAKGIYHVKEAIASSTLQIAPSAYIRTHTYTLTQACLLKGWPLPLDRSQRQRGYILPVTVALCCPPGDGAQPLQPASLPRVGSR